SGRGWVVYSTDPRRKGAPISSSCWFQYATASITSGILASLGGDATSTVGERSHGWPNCCACAWIVRASPSGSRGARAGMPPTRARASATPAIPLRGAVATPLADDIVAPLIGNHATAARCARDPGSRRPLAVGCPLLLRSVREFGSGPDPLP